MRKKVVAIILAGGLMLGIGGCGGNESTAWAPQDTEAESVQDDLSEPEVEEAGAEEIDVEEFGDEEFDQAETEETETISDEEDFFSDIDTSSLLTEHVLEYEDYDGYKIRETIQLSPIFREDDSETIYALWEALGEDVADFPSKESLRESNHNLKGWNEFEYIIGTFAIENLTEGFSITAENPRTYSKSLTTRGNSNAASLFQTHSASAVVYSNGITRYGSDYLFSAVIGDAKMTSNTWGPRTFVIALPNAYTPNQPDGYRYDEVEVVYSCYNGYGSYDHSDYETLMLEYFE